MEDNKKTEELKGLILETIKGGIGAVKEEMAIMKETIAKTEEKVNAVIATPTKNVSLNVPGGTGTKEFMYNGFNLNYQGRDSVIDSALRIKDETLKNEISKMLINCVNARNTMKEYNVNAGPMVEGTAGSGGYLVFDEFMNVIRTLGQLSGVMLSEAEVVTMNSDILHYPVDNNKTVTTAFKTETTALADGIPSDIVSEVTLTAKRLGAYALLTNELIEDSTFDVVSFLMQKFAASISRSLDAQVFRVAGNDSLDSLIASTSGIQDSTGTLNIAHLLDAYSKLDARQSAGAKYYFHRLVHYGTILNQTDTAGNAIFPPSLTNMGKQLWQIPVVLVEDLPYTLTDDSIVGLLCNMKQAYVIGQRKGIGSFFFNPYSTDLEYQTRISLQTRWAGKVGFPTSCVALRY